VQPRFAPVVDTLTRDVVVILLRHSTAGYNDFHGTRFADFTRESCPTTDGIQNDRNSSSLRANLAYSREQMLRHAALACFR
jgi:hypothetical protein